MSTVDRMREKLAAIAPESMEIVDESAKHAGHEGAKSGGGHYLLTIVSTHFAGQNTLARHRLVYNTLGELMHKEIHALSIKAYTPDEI
jgi:BolA family transcriptional regulator, general stress-responsive regulator